MGGWVDLGITFLEIILKRIVVIIFMFAYNSIISQYDPFQNYIPDPYSLHNSIWINVYERGYKFDFTYPRQIAYDIDGYPPFDGHFYFYEMIKLSENKYVGGEFKKVKSKYNGMLLYMRNDMGEKGNFIGYKIVILTDNQGILWSDDWQRAIITNTLSYNNARLLMDGKLDPKGIELRRVKGFASFWDKKDNPSSK